MYFKKAGHRHNRVGSQVGRTVVIACPGASTRQVKEILQVVFKLSGKILREFYDFSVPIRFADGEVVEL